MIGFYDYTVIATYLSLISSMAGIWLSAKGMPDYALMCLLFSGMLDMFDGKIARTKKRSDPEKRFGIQIDSLSDLVAFGVLPAMIGYSYIKSPLFLIEMALYVLAALIRLAYFNVTEETRQDSTEAPRKEYLGLPVTSSALMIPLIRLLLPITGKMYPVIFASVLAAAGLLFVIPFRLKKPGNKGITAFFVIGTLVLILLAGEIFFNIL